MNRNFRTYFSINNHFAFASLGENLEAELRICAILCLALPYVAVGL